MQPMSFGADRTAGSTSLFIATTIRHRKDQSCDVIRYNMAVESSWNVMAHGDAWEGKWRGTWRMEWVVSTLHTTSEHGISSITTADAHNSADSSRLNWRPRRFKLTRPFRRKTKSVFCACAITFQTQSTEAVLCKFRTEIPLPSNRGTVFYWLVTWF
jgi:hypothetical protein